LVKHTKLINMSKTAELILFKYQNIINIKILLHLLISKMSKENWEKTWSFAYCLHKEKTLRETINYKQNNK
jgi:hypothetical protein